MKRLIVESIGMALMFGAMWGHNAILNLPVFQFHWRPWLAGGLIWLCSGINTNLMNAYRKIKASEGEREDPQPPR